VIKDIVLDVENPESGAAGAAELKHKLDHRTNLPLFVLSSFGECLPATRMVKGRSGSNYRDCATGTLYPALLRLEQRGQMSSKWMSRKTTANHI
jgi:hypothetical protein